MKSSSKRKAPFVKLLDGVKSLGNQTFQLPPAISQEHKKATRDPVLPYGLTGYGELPAVVRCDGFLPASPSCNVCRYGRLCELCVEPDKSMRIQWRCPCHSRDQLPSKVRVLAPDTRVRLDFGEKKQLDQLRFIEKEPVPTTDAMREDVQQNMQKKADVCDSVRFQRW
eukprot:EC715997.1.p1 GENE.EC715997.1~~EC715997.1.p1  ORF type:complete len:168 (+),score=5.95 EC715997.1:33-536(+)